jgi:hypothetical protein
VALTGREARRGTLPPGGGEGVDATATWLEEVRQEFARLRQQAERAAAQVAAADLTRRPAAEANSLAVLWRHVGGNLKSRFTDFLTSDGEKEGRDRDAEFDPDAAEDPAVARLAWEDGWTCLEATLAALTPSDLARRVVIRGESLSVPAALTRALSHTAGHVGQIVFLAKLWAGPSWQTLSVPRGQSRAYTEAVRRRAAGGPAPQP